MASARGATSRDSPKLRPASASSTSARSRSSAAAPSLIDARVAHGAPLSLELLAGCQGELVDLGQRRDGGVGIAGGVSEPGPGGVEPGEQIGESGIRAHCDASPPRAMAPSTPFTNDYASEP